MTTVGYYQSNFEPISSQSGILTRHVQKSFNQKVVYVTQGSTIGRILTTKYPAFLEKFDIVFICFQNS